MGSNAEVKPQELVDAFYAAFGDNHSRAVHAKGVLLEGRFVPDERAGALSRAALFAKPSVPVLARFSDFTGLPRIPDTAAEASPRGFAIKFLVPGGTELDIVAHSFDGFPVKTSAEFRQLLLALSKSGPDAARPTPLEEFFATHPIAKAFLTTQKPPPASYATLAYFGVNAFEFTNDRSEAKYVRYRFVPKLGEQILDRRVLEQKGPDYLREEIQQRAAREPIEFEWLAQVAEPADAVDDPSIAWPRSRALLRLGAITLDRVAENQTQSDRATLFLPANLPDGIEAADPMLGQRNDAYPLSYRHRQ